MPRRDPLTERDAQTADLTGDRDDFEHRLKAKLDARKADEAKRNARPEGWALGLRYGSEFIAGVLAGGLLGFAIDWVAGWSPWGLLVGVLLGFAAGTRNVVRVAREVNDAGDGRPESGDDA